MPGPWTIETVKGKRFTCFARTMKTAQQVARKLGRPIIVRYANRKTPGNRSIDRSDFRLFPDGRRDATIDPTWYNYKPPKKKG